MRHALIAVLAGSCVGLGLWLGDRIFFSLAAAIVVGYALALWVRRRRGEK
ncbi:hypothetical protein ACM64Y_03780 [Novispirillum sp. DQ9]